MAALMSHPGTERADPRAIPSGGVAIRMAGRPYLGQTAGHEPQDPSRPRIVAEDQRSMLQQRGVPLDLRHSSLSDLADQQLALGVQTLHLHGQGARSGQVLGGEELDGHTGVGQAAQGVETRGQLEADMFRREVDRVEQDNLQQLLEPQPLRVTQPLQASLQQVAGVPCLCGHVGDDAQRHQIQVLGRVGRAPRLLVQGLRQLVGAADTRQLSQGVGGRQHLGVDQGIRRGQDTSTPCSRA